MASQPRRGASHTLTPLMSRILEVAYPDLDGRLRTSQQTQGGGGEVASAQEGAASHMAPEGHATDSDMTSETEGEGGSTTGTRGDGSDTDTSSEGSSLAVAATSVPTDPTGTAANQRTSSALPAAPRPSAHARKARKPAISFAPGTSGPAPVTPAALSEEVIDLLRTIIVGQSTLLNAIQGVEREVHQSNAYLEGLHSGEPGPQDSITGGPRNGKVRCSLSGKYWPGVVHWKHKTGTAEQGPAVRSTAEQGPAVRSTGEQGPAVRSTGEQGPAVRSTGEQGPAVRSTGEQGPAVTRTAERGPTVRSTAERGPAVRSTAEQGPAVRSTAEQGPAVRSTAEQGPAVRSTAEQGPAVRSTAEQGPAVTRTAEQGPAVTRTAEQGPAVRSTAEQGPSVRSTAEQGPSCQAPLRWALPVKHRSAGHRRL
ncbi:hypothetical protein NDU88_005257 [Pleurodeles waltl]|uniref:Uncharacterized protein n=1 Tax=Pleurodeles waltl TaxID=8319 RepID=A0AAV7RKZ6_PLEWA|nr:hypothetical protein NDU88_005257 [Pleurodeles waltl]